MYKVKVVDNNQTYEFDSRMTLEDIANHIGHKGALVAKVNNRLRELTYYVEKDCQIEFLEINDVEGSRAYQTTLRYLLVYAINKAFKGYDVMFTQFVSRSILCVIPNMIIDEEKILKIKCELDSLIKRNVKIERYKATKEEAIEIYKRQGFNDKIELLKYRTEPFVNLNRCEDYYNYNYSYMLPSAGYIYDYNLTKYGPAMVVQYPRSDSKGEIPDFEDDPSLTQMIKESYEWSKLCKVTSLASMNAFTEDRGFVDLVNMCETKHNNTLAELGGKIKENIDHIKLIAIAGPSSSGKTTFCNRLRVELMSRGIFPLMISLDNYYKIEGIPKDENGKYDFEDIEALDLDLFNKDLKTLIEGGEVALPIYNFGGNRTFGEKVRLEKGQPILIEGIHALNERLSYSIDRSEKYKIYISPFPVINFDYHDPIWVTDIRKLRRVVRDKQFRGTSPEKTFEMWPSVRKGEFKWIYPFQKEADFVFNTALTYEIMVMKKYALPALQAIESDNPHYIEANRLIKFLKLVKDIDDKYVPCNSILREFIGGSCFYDN